MAFRVLVQIATILYLVYGLDDSLEGNLIQLLILPTNLFLSITLCTLLDLAIDYVERDDFSSREKDS